MARKPSKNIVEVILVEIAIPLAVYAGTKTIEWLFGRKRTK
jgi:hypothetical protein